MSVLFMMPLWRASSEVWMQRMLESLGDRLGLVVTSNTGGAKRWNDCVRAVSLNEPASLSRRILRRLHVGNGTRSPEKTLIQEIQRSGITHVLCQYGTFATRFMNVWQSINIPLFVHFHGYDATFDLRSHTNSDVRVHSVDYQRLVINLSQRAKYIANSEFTKSNLIQAGVNPSKIVVKYLGVPVLKTERFHVRKQEVTILQLGRLVDFKSPDRTIQAFEIARSKGLNAKLIIAGDGPLRVLCELIRSRSKFRDDISIQGEVSSNVAQDLIASADIYTQHNIKGEVSNQEEALGVSILEAMAAGLPVVGTRSGGVNETVVDGETGFLVEPGNVDAQAMAVLKLGLDADLRNKMGRYARAKVEGKFSSEIERKHLYQILDLTYA